MWVGSTTQPNDESIYLYSTERDCVSFKFRTQKEISELTRNHLTMLPTNFYGIYSSVVSALLRVRMLFYHYFNLVSIGCIICL